MKNLLDQINRELGNDVVEASEDEIVSPFDREVHLIDDGGLTEIADTELRQGGGGDSIFADDFTHMVEQRERAMFGPNGEPLDDFDQNLMIREQQRREIAEQGDDTHQTNNPSSWDRGLLGGNVIVQPGTATAQGQTQTVAYWPGDDFETLPVVVTIAPLMPLPAGAQVRPFARVRWATRNGEFTAEIDCGTGMQFCITASSVYVDVGQDAGSNQQIQVYGALSYWGTNTATPAYRTSYIDSIGIAATVNVKRPAFATTLFGFERASNGAYTLNFRDINGTLIGSRSYAAANYIINPISLPNDCASIDVVNGSGGIDTVRLVWGLSF